MPLPKEINDTLILLVKRNNIIIPSTMKEERHYDWFITGFNYAEKPAKSCDYCLVCGAILDFNETYKHGIAHLKEYNLLVFI